jgi:hypothetical protein
MVSILRHLIYLINHTRLEGYMDEQMSESQLMQHFLDVASDSLAGSIGSIQQAPKLQEMITNGVALLVKGGISPTILREAEDNLRFLLHAIGTSTLQTGAVEQATGGVASNREEFLQIQGKGDKIDTEIEVVLLSWCPRYPWC